MIVLNDRPPNYNAINAEFHVERKKVIFCYGDTIYNPMGIMVGPDLIAHETTHSRQQGDNPADWWARYIKDRSFRLWEEAEAHHNEYQYWATELRDREQLNRHLHAIAMKLAAPLYGRLVTFDKALGYVKHGLPRRPAGMDQRESTATG